MIAELAELAALARVFAELGAGFVGSQVSESRPGAPGSDDGAGMAERDPEMEIVAVFESDDVVAFELAKAVLDEAGVEYMVHEDPPARFGFSPFLNPMRRILMPAYRKDEALGLIAEAQQELKSSEDEDGE